MLVSIIGGIAAITGFYIISNGTFGVQAVEDNIENTTAEISDQLPRSVISREPLVTYMYCYSYIRGDYEDDRYDTAETDCYDKRFDMADLGGSHKRLASYKFHLPAALDNLVAIRTESTVYEYGENDFELGLFDEVGEKRYQVSLWEFPK